MFGLCDFLQAVARQSVPLNDQKKPKTVGSVIEALPDATFRVQLEDGTVVLAYLAGKMRIHYVKVMVGDRVTLETTPDRTRGRIVYRN
jgi:translation initiation factor IF-1